MSQPPQAEEEEHETADLPPDVLRLILRHASVTAAAHGGDVRDLQRIRSVNRLAREASQQAYDRHAASGQDPKELRANLTFMRRACMVAYDTNPRHMFMISASVAFNTDAAGMRRKIGELCEALDAKGLASTPLVHACKPVGRKKRGRAWCPPVVRVSCPDQLSVMMDIGYTRGSNAIVAAVKRSSTASALVPADECRIALRASFGPMYCRWETSRSQLAAHKDAALFDVDIRFADEVVRCTFMYPRFCDITRTCDAGGEAAHHIARFIYSSQVAHAFLAPKNAMTP